MVSDRDIPNECAAELRSACVCVWLVIVSDFKPSSVDHVSNSRPTGRMWPSRSFCVVRGSLKCLN